MGRYNLGPQLMGPQLTGASTSMGASATMAAMSLDATSEATAMMALQLQMTHINVMLDATSALSDVLKKSADKVESAAR